MLYIAIFNLVYVYSLIRIVGMKDNCNLTPHKHSHSLKTSSPTLPPPTPIPPQPTTGVLGDACDRHEDCVSVIKGSRCRYAMCVCGGKYTGLMGQNICHVGLSPPSGGGGVHGYACSKGWARGVLS